LDEMLSRCNEIGFKFKPDVSYKYIVDDNDQIIAVVGVEGDDAMLHLLEAFQGQGLGRTAVELCLANGLSLYADEDWGNKGAFEKYGLKTIGVSDTHGCHIMRK